ncbi:MAG: hypothetical protein M3Z08_00025 [Chloroflexota bacterium]|nr:hypothetical protein [Chloroflexota bacterium]
MITLILVMFVLLGISIGSLLVPYALTLPKRQPRILLVCMALVPMLSLLAACNGK